MHTLKLIILLVLTVVVMRLGSWLIGWLLGLLLNCRPTILRLLSNLLGFAAFSALLILNRYPGEPLDFEAVLFGAIVFAVCFASDLNWYPWSKDRRMRSTAQHH